jgi:hypothetical protein
MNLKGTKTFGGDKRYWFYDLTATSDGGCLIVGMVPDFVGAVQKDAYVVKIMPEDVITDIETLAICTETEISVFPNPFKDILHLKSSENKTQFSLFTKFGQQILKTDIPTKVNTTLQAKDLKPGVYFYTLRNENNGTFKTGKLIKQ